MSFRYFMLNCIIIYWPKPKFCFHCVYRFYVFETSWCRPSGNFFGQSYLVCTHFLLHTCYILVVVRVANFLYELGSLFFGFSSFSVSFHTTQKSKGSVLVLCYNICLVTVKWFRKIYIAGDFMNDEYTSI